LYNVAKQGFIQCVQDAGAACSLGFFFFFFFCFLGFPFLVSGLNAREIINRHGAKRAQASTAALSGSRNSRERPRHSDWQARIGEAEHAGFPEVGILPLGDAYVVKAMYND
jgi:hypothetical protein